MSDGKDIKTKPDDNGDNVIANKEVEPFFIDEFQMEGILKILDLKTNKKLERFCVLDDESFTIA